jgi:hypothetical protein
MLSMLALRMKIHRKISHGLPSVGEEGGLLIVLHPLRLQHLE